MERGDLLMKVISVCFKGTENMINLQVKEQLNAMMGALKRANFIIHNYKGREH